jgi:hypothetical protein
MNQRISLSFKERARKHQIKFREEVLKVGYDGFETILTDSDAKAGLNFFDGFKINEYAQNRYPHFKLKEACFANMLRSEHIPFNFFVPLSKNPEYARAVFNRFMGGLINIITEIRIDYSPDPEKAFKHKTSFDVFIEYRHTSGGIGIIGIEVKYAERESPLVKKSKENIEIIDPESIYNTLTEKIGLYRKDEIPKLKTDEFRQVWIKHILGESMTRKIHPESKYEYFTSIILYPDGNDHFRELIPKYKSLLNPGHESSLKGISYEEFISVAREYTVEVDFLRWLQYLKDRYIISL